MVANLDPYSRQLSYPKWNIKPTVLQEPRLMRRLPEFATWNKAQHEAVARVHLQVSADMRAIYTASIASGIAAYGDEGPLISGVHREHWPAWFKASLRSLAASLIRHEDIAKAHWNASGKRRETFRALRETMAVTKAGKA